MVLKIAPGGAVNTLCVGTVPDHDCVRRVKTELAVCESLSESATMIAHGETRPRWHNERRQAKVNFRPRSSSISAIRTLQLLKRLKPQYVLSDNQCDSETESVVSVK